MNLKPTVMNECRNTPSKQHRIDRSSKKPSTRNGIDQFVTEAAKIEDTSLQISDTKIPQDAKKLGQQFEKGVHPRTNKPVGESNPVDTADKQTHTRKAMGKNV